MRIHNIADSLKSEGFTEPFLASKQNLGLIKLGLYWILKNTDKEAFYLKNIEPQLFSCQPIRECQAQAFKNKTPIFTYIHIGESIRVEVTFNAAHGIYNKEQFISYTLEGDYSSQGRSITGWVCFYSYKTDDFPAKHKSAYV